MGELLILHYLITANRSNFSQRFTAYGFHRLLQGARR